MQPPSALRPPLSQKSSNAQPIDLTCSTAKRYRLSLASAKARNNVQSQDESADRSVPGKKQQKTNVMPEKQAVTKTQDVLQLKKEAWSSEDELVRPRKHVKTKTGVVKRRTLSDKIEAPVSVPYDATAPANSECKNKEAVIENSIDIAAFPSSMSSPLYNDDNDDFMKSSPPSPIFYERIVPRQMLPDDSDSSSDDFEKLAVHKSPLMAKQRRNQVHQSAATAKTSTSTAVVSAEGEPRRNASRSILSELTSASKRNGQRLSIPHASGQSLADTSLPGKTRVGQEQLDQVPSMRQTMKAKAVDSPRMHTCPICNQEFSTSVIEVHASDCNGEPSMASRTTSKPTMQSSLQWSFPKKKAFTVYRDDEADVRSAKEDTKECPICHEQVVISMFKQHVDSELNDLTSGHTVSREDHNSAFEKNVPSTAVDVDDHASDSDCSVIDLSADPYPYRPSSSNVPSEDSLRETAPVEPGRERSWSPVEGFQDIRQLKEQDPGYQMYFQQFNGRSSSRRGRRKSTGDGQDECTQPITSKAKTASSKSKPYKAKPSSAALRRYRQYKRKGKN